MQVNRTGYLLFALFGGGGTLFIIAGVLIGGQVAFTFILLGSIWVLVTLGLIVYMFRQNARGRHEQWLWKTGVMGRGTLVSAQARAEVNDEPLISLELDLEVPGQAPRRVKRRLIVSRFAAVHMKPGLVLPVYVNPADPDDILIVW